MLFVLLLIFLFEILKQISQVLQDACEVHPYMDTYYHKRDHSLLVVMHNPIGPDLKNHEPWSTKLHSNVGFRYAAVMQSLHDKLCELEAKCEAIDSVGLFVT